MAELLLIGRDRQAVSGIRGLLREDGHRITRHHSTDDWRVLEKDVRPELIVATAECADAMLKVRSSGSRGFPTPLLFVREDSGFSRDLFSEDRLVDQITSPFMREELLARVDALVRVRRVIHHEPSPESPPVRVDEDQPPRRHRASMMSRFASFLGSSLPKAEKPAAPYMEVAARVAEWTDRRDAYQPGHAERVTSFCGMIADGLGLDDEETSGLLRAAMLHDIGKVSLPVEMLHQREPLRENQVRLIRTHPRRGAALLRALDKDERVARTVLFHHECPDGSGYYGKSLDGVPRTARILAVAEVFDAMTSSTLVEPLPKSKALRSLKDKRGATLDAEAVDALTSTLKPRKTVIPLATRPL